MKHRGGRSNRLDQPELPTGPFVNGQFRESGADNLKKKKKGMTRKELRQSRKESKQSRVKDHELWKRSKKLGVSLDELKEQNSNQKKRKRQEEEDEYQEEVQDYESEQEELEKKPLKRQKTRAEAEDDRIIKSMEKKLGLTGKSQKSIGDGLDFLFEGIGSDAEEEQDVRNFSDSDQDDAPRARKPLNPRDIFGKSWKGDDGKEGLASASEEVEESDNQEELDSEVDFEEDVASGPGSASEDEGEMDDESNVSEMDQDIDSNLDDASDLGLGIDDGSTDSEDDGTMFGSGNPYIKFDEDSDDDVEESQESDDENSKSDDESSSEAKPVPKSTPKSGVYIPPALRAKMAGADSALVQMSRELRGHINRLSDSNIDTIFELVESLFSKYPRKAVNEELVKLLLDDCAASIGGASVFTFAPTYAALTMMLHLTVGAEIGGNVVQGTARELQQRLVLNDMAVLRNLLLMFINFYNYSVIHCSMVYDIIRQLAKHLNEQNVDLLVLVIQKCGAQLRKDDPTAIKDIIELVNSITVPWRESWDRYNQEKTSGSGGMELSLPERGSYTKRVQFMIEALNDVKNNRVVAQQADEATLKMKASIDKYWKKRFRTKPSPEPLKISWTDLVESDHLGRWWVVGSATQIPSEQRAEARKEAQLKKAVTDAKRGSGGGDVESLAKAQHMNTAVRKAIFSIIVTSEDYIDACEQLTRFESKEMKPREISQVILHCCQQENAWNPYYASLAEKLCTVDHKYKISFKFLLWEKLEALDTSSVRALANFAKFYAHLIGCGQMTPSILKAFPFEELSPKAIIFLRMILTCLFLEFKETNIAKLFAGTAANSNFADFVQQLDFFIQTHMKNVALLAKQARLTAGPHEVPDSQAADHVKTVCNTVRHAMAQAMTV
jgi:nucleolar MIF4G domain-containing protein 1